jgi:hypothetical protein
MSWVRPLLMSMMIPALNALAQAPVSLPTPSMPAGHPDISRLLTTTSSTQDSTTLVVEQTEEMPAWNVQMRHLIVRRLNSAIQVTDMLYLTNPSAKTWIGTVRDGKHVTLDLPLPSKVTNVQISTNLRDAGTEFLNGHVVSAIPLPSGQTAMQVSYTLPLAPGGVAVSVSAPAPVTRMMVFVPEDGTNIVVTGLGVGTKIDVGQGESRLYQGEDLPTGANATIAVGDMFSRAPAAVESTGAASHLPRIIGIGSLIIVIGGSIVIFMRPSTRADKVQDKAGPQRGPRRRGKE